MTIAIRPAGAADVAAVDALLRDSFPAADEADLVRRLCVDGDMVLMLVAAEEDGTLVHTESLRSAGQHEQNNVLRDGERKKVGV